MKTIVEANSPQGATADRHREVFANQRACVTRRVYPTRGDRLEVDLFAFSGSATATALDVWELDSIW